MNGSRYLWTLGPRETARREWRGRVDAAAREWERVRPLMPQYHAGALRATRLRDDVERLVQYVMGRWPRMPEDRETVADAHLRALAAPRPWRSAQRPDPRRKFSRAHRRGCAACRSFRPKRDGAFIVKHETRSWRFEGDSSSFEAWAKTLKVTPVVVKLTRQDPHGRSA